MKHSEVLSRYVNTGSQIPEEQYDRLTPSLKKSYMRMRSVVGYERWEFKTLSYDEKIKFLETDGYQLNRFHILPIFKYSNDKDKDKIAIKIIDVKGDELTEYDINKLLEYSNDKDLIATKIIDAKGKELDGDDINKLLKYSENKELITTKIIQTKGNKLKSNDVSYLLDYSQDKDLIVKKFIEVGLQIYEEQYKQLSPSWQKYYRIIRGVHGYENWEFDYLTDYERIKFIEKTGGIKNSKYDIGYLLRYSEDKELIKKLLLQKGIDYKLINNMLLMFKIDTPLIPDNYQEMLNEIKRIKQIMR
jgi:hypothetical protein